MSLALSDKRGVLVVGASHAPATNNENELEKNSRAAKREESPEGSWRSIYIYTYANEARDANGIMLRYPAWAQHDTRAVTSYSATFTTRWLEEFASTVLAQLFAYGYVEAAKSSRGQNHIPKLSQIRRSGHRKGEDSAVEGLGRTLWMVSCSRRI